MASRYHGVGWGQSLLTASLCRVFPSSSVGDYSSQGWPCPKVKELLEVPELELRLTTSNWVTVKPGHPLCPLPSLSHSLQR